MYETSQRYIKNCTNIDAQVTQAGLSMRRRKALAKVVNAVMSNTETVHDYFGSRRDEMDDKLNADAITTGNLQAAELNSTGLKQSLNNLADIINSSGNSTVAQDLRNAMRAWGDIHRCLVNETESARKRWGEHYECTIMTLDYLALLREDIDSLQDVSAELRKRIGEHADQRRPDTE
jgi:hypothetical protein